MNPSKASEKKLKDFAQVVTAFQAATARCEAALIRFQLTAPGEGKKEAEKLYVKFLAERNAIREVLMGAFAEELKPKSSILKPHEVLQ